VGAELGDDYGTIDLARPFVDRFRGYPHP